MVCESGFKLLSSKAFAVINIPGEQYPHCDAPRSAKAVCKGCGSPFFPKPSIV